MLYHDAIMDHYRYSPHRGTLENPDLQARVENLSCGDSIVIQATVEDGYLIKIVFQGAGCVISQAAASMLIGLAQGKPINEIMHYDKSTMLSLLAIELGPTRLRCGLLSLEALHNAIIEFQKEGNKE